jgi:hypothetical protein
MIRIVVVATVGTLSVVGARSDVEPVPIEARVVRLAFDDWVDESGRLRFEALPPLGEESCGFCSSCTPSGGGLGHFAEPHETGLRLKGAHGWHAGCQTGTCLNSHPIDEQCFDEEEQQQDEFLQFGTLMRLWEKIEVGAAPIVAAQFTANVEWDAAADMLRVFGCAGNLVAQVPVLPVLGTAQ